MEYSLFDISLFTQINRLMFKILNDSELLTDPTFFRSTSTLLSLSINYLPDIEVLVRSLKDPVQKQVQKQNNTELNTVETSILEVFCYALPNISNVIQLVFDALKQVSTLLVFQMLSYFPYKATGTSRAL